MPKLLPNHILKFGKNKNLLLSEVYQYQPSYIEWAIMNIPDFKIDIEEFEKLPPPTTFGYNANHYSKKEIENSNDFKFNKDNETESIMDFIEQYAENNDIVNNLVSIQELKEMMANSQNYQILHGFKFPQVVREKNDSKY